MIGQNLFLLLKLGIETADAHDGEFEPLLVLSMEQWRELMDLATRQGVASIAIDGVQRLYETYGKGIKVASEAPVEWSQWVIECTGILTQYEQFSLAQRKVISGLSEIWAKDSIRVMVFKGQANASFYPVPEHRATGDIDCWLFGDAEKGDSLIKKMGAIVDNSWYRHSKIIYNGETLENHRVLSHTRGSKRKKEMEKELVALLDSANLSKINGCGEALLPPAQFNAHFLLYHALHHFLSEGLRIKQVLDWAMFLKAEQDNVDWNTFNEFCEKYRFERFAAVMNHIANTYFAVELKCPGIITDETYSKKVIESTLYDDDYLFNSGKGNWTVRWLLVKNMLTRDRWKYLDVAQENVWKHLWENVKGYLKDKD